MIPLIEEFNEQIEYYNDDVNYYHDNPNVSECPTKPEKLNNVITNIPKCVENHILEYSGHNQSYEKTYVDYVFETLFIRTDIFSKFIDNVKWIFNPSSQDHLKLKGDAKERVKEQLKKHIDEMTKIYDELNQ